jgi:hypothetical protein
MTSWWRKAWSTISGTDPPTQISPGTVVEPRAGSTSFHLWWTGIDSHEWVTEASVTLEVLQQPTARRLYFWAMQASFHDRFRRYGAAHIGLQWNPRHVGMTAVNWGGYSDPSIVASILEGSESPLPNSIDDRNTRDFAWTEGTRYRFHVFPSPERGWRGEVTDLDEGRTWLVRDLYAGGDRLQGLVVWSELFCACTDPQAVVRWSDPEVVTNDGRRLVPRGAKCTFPMGGCTNMDSVPTPEGLVQVTMANRRARDGDVLPWVTPG